VPAPFPTPQFKRADGSSSADGRGAGGGDAAAAGGGNAEAAEGGAQREAAGAAAALPRGMIGGGKGKRGGAKR
jgi:hypothetical protein